ncbi:MAG: lysylphosphatidylglycerol synthase transmembrane domain-containing protein [Burkholderiaceae bacterium]
MKLRYAVASLIGISLVYAMLLLVIDTRNPALALLPEISRSLPVLLTCSLGSFILRYLRWRWLLIRAGHRIDWLKGFIAYSSGFAFTATPGKLGELLRIRYFARDHVPAETVIAAFVYERLFDLAAIALLSLPAALALGGTTIAFGFAAAISALAIGLARHPRSIGWFARIAQQRGWRNISRLLDTLARGLTGIFAWRRPVDFIVSFTTGLLAWSLTCGAFAYLLAQLGSPLSPAVSSSVYAVAMLAGAASMIPGGLGSTEAAIVALLALSGMALGTAALSAVAIRIVTLWFAILLGVVSVSALEWLAARRA